MRSGVRFIQPVYHTDAERECGGRVSDASTKALDDAHRLERPDMKRGSNTVFAIENNGASR
jgi:hypothetical protein